MNLNEFLKNFAEQFEETSFSDFNPETRFRDIEEWDSLHALAIMAMSSEKYHVKITPDEIKKSETVADIFEIIKSKL